MLDFKTRLKQETLELAEKLNKLHKFMADETFYVLSRETKDLLYQQAHYMLSYLQVLGKRCEMLGIDLEK